MSGTRPSGDGHPEFLRGAYPGMHIEHKLVPGFPMEFQDATSCKTDRSRPEPHAKYKVTDPDGSTNWLCAYDVRPVGSTKGTRS